MSLGPPRVLRDVGHGVTWDDLSASDLAERCAVPRVELFSEIESTLDVAHALAENGAPAGTVVLADCQRAGRGRLGRSWSSLPGHGVWVTVLERPADRRTLDVLSLRLGLLLAESLDVFARQQVGVKWPNDLVLRDGKLGGILVEARWSGAALAWVAIGVGVNVGPPPDVSGAAGLPGASRVDVLHAIVSAIRAAAAAVGDLTPEELARFEERDALIGRDVVEPGIGSVAGVDATGALVINTARGSERHRAGTVRLADAVVGGRDS